MRVDFGDNQSWGAVGSIIGLGPKGGLMRLNKYGFHYDWRKRNKTFSPWLLARHFFAHGWKGHVWW